MFLCNDISLLTMMEYVKYANGLKFKLIANIF